MRDHAPIPDEATKCCAGVAKRNRSPLPPSCPKLESCKAWFVSQHRAKALFVRYQKVFYDLSARVLAVEVA